MNSVATAEPDVSLKLPLSQVSGEVMPDKPTWRGWIHTGVLPIAFLGGIVLLITAEGWVAKVGSAVFFASSILLFGNSALYHRLNWKPETRLLLKRIDHANIFLLIAGSYTPITLLALERDKALLLLSAIWVAALLGIAFRVFWINAPRWLYVPIYILMGWAALVFIQDFLAANAPMMILILIGGLCYTLGAVVYALKRPNPFPGHFGFHEIFHSFTVIAFLCHWAAVLLIGLDPLASSFGG